MTAQITRPVTKRAVRAAPFTPPATLFVLLPGMRPVAGDRLLAHTHAALEVLGLMQARPAPTARVVALIGPRAFAYHSKVLHSLEAVGATTRLTKAGLALMSAREKEGKVSRELVDAFRAVFVTGKASETAQVARHHISPRTV